MEKPNEAFKEALAATMPATGVACSAYHQVIAAYGLHSCMGLDETVAADIAMRAQNGKLLAAAWNACAGDHAFGEAYGFASDAQRSAMQIGAQLVYAGLLDQGNGAELAKACATGELLRDLQSEAIGSGGHAVTVLAAFRPEGDLGRALILLAWGLAKRGLGDEAGAADFARRLVSAGPDCLGASLIAYAFQPA